MLHISLTAALEDDPWAPGEKTAQAEQTEAHHLPEGKDDRKETWSFRHHNTAAFLTPIHTVYSTHNAVQFDSLPPTYPFDTTIPTHQTCLYKITCLFSTVYTSTTSMSTVKSPTARRPHATPPPRT